MDRGGLLQCLHLPEPQHRPLSLSERQMAIFIPGPGHIALENLALVIDCAPQVVRLAIDLHKHLVEVPPPVAEAAHTADPLTADVSGEQWPEAVPPKRTVSWQTSIPGSASRSSTFLSDSGNLTYISTTSRITSGDELNRRNGDGGRARERRGIGTAISTLPRLPRWSDSAIYLPRHHGEAEGVDAADGSTPWPGSRTISPSTPIASTRSRNLPPESGQEICHVQSVHVDHRWRLLAFS